MIKSKIFELTLPPPTHPPTILHGSQITFTSSQKSLHRQIHQFLFSKRFLTLVIPSCQVCIVLGLAPFVLAEESSRYRISRNICSQCSNDKLWGGSQTCTIIFLAAVSPASQIFLDLSLIQIGELSSRRCKAGSMGNLKSITSDSVRTTVFQKL